MAEGLNRLEDFATGLIEGINKFVPEEYKIYLGLVVFIVLATIYSIFIWKFHRFLAKRDILELNLSQYNRSEHPLLTKFFSVLLFIAEFIIILPAIVFFWFFVISIILLFLAKGQEIQNILLISAVLVSTIRISAYYNEGLAKELAKLFPFTILIFAILEPGFFNLAETIGKISEVPSLLSNIIFYLFAIMALEFMLRMLYLLIADYD